MIITLIIFLPLILVTIWTIYKSIQRHVLSTAICIPVFSFLFIFHMLYITDYWYSGHHEWNTMSRIDCWVYPFLIPTIYIYTCVKVGRQRAILNGITMLALALMNFTTGIIVNLKGGPTIVDEEIFQITITWGNRILLICPIQEFVMMLQALWFASRLFNYRYVMKREHTHLNEETILLGRAILLTIFAGLVGVFLPESLFDMTWKFFLISALPISLTLTRVIYLIGKGYLLTPIMDENNEQAISTITESKADVFRKIDYYVKSSKCFLNNKLLISDVAKAVETNRLYASNAIQEATGENFSTYINTFRVEAAKNIIINKPRIRLDDVAEQCGFGSASSFTKIFKKHTGITPSELRAKPRIIPKGDYSAL